MKTSSIRRVLAVQRAVYPRLSQVIERSPVFVFATLISNVEILQCGYIRDTR